MADITVTEHLLLHQKRTPQATGQFTGLLYDLILSGKSISRRINKAGLLDILGGTGEVNVQGENVQKMDAIANRIMIYRMERCGALCAMSSEEEAELIRVSPEFPRGDYILLLTRWTVPPTSTSTSMWALFSPSCVGPRGTRVK